MDEAEKYQQRVQAIADKRRKQQEDEKARREMEEEWLMQAQRKADVEEGGIQDIITAAGGQLSGPMMKRVLCDNGLEGRSVLGMVAVPVERDSKTGLTKVRSVVPVSGAPGALGEAVFNDSRKSVHHIGGAEGQPSAEELGQILSVINDVGMQVLLDAVPVVPQQKAEEEKEVVSGMEEEVDNVEDPATPTTLGYTEKKVEDLGHEDDRELVKVERVIISDAGEEVVLQSTVVGSETEPFLGYTQEEVEDLGHEDDPPRPTPCYRAEETGKRAFKTKTKCCSIM